MAKRKALGKGLGAFFPDYDSSQHEQNNSTSEKGGEENYTDTRQRVNVVLHVPVNHIRPNPHQPRKEFDEQRLLDLSNSIQRHGLIQPLTVHPLGEERYELISGERRLRAAKLAGAEKVPAYIREVEDDEILAFALIENIQREELNPIEVATGYQRLMEECNYTQEEVARKIGKNRSTITNMLRLLHLPDFIQAAIRDEKISMGHARAVITIEDLDAQKKLIERVINEDLSVRQIEEVVRNYQEELKKPSKNSKKQQEQSREEEAIYRSITSKLRDKLSTKVDLKTKKKGGEIRIAYYSDDELDRILRLFENI